MMKKTTANPTNMFRSKDQEKKNQETSHHERPSPSPHTCRAIPQLGKQNSPPLSIKPSNPGMKKRIPTIS
jgi:hypothetical protein